MRICFNQSNDAVTEPRYLTLGVVGCDRLLKSGALDFVVSGQGRLFAPGTGRELLRPLALQCDAILGGSRRDAFPFVNLLQERPLRRPSFSSGDDRASR